MRLSPATERTEEILPSAVAYLDTAAVEPHGLAARYYVAAVVLIVLKTAPPEVVRAVAAISAGEVPTAALAGLATTAPRLAVQLRVAQAVMEDNHR